MFFRPLRQLALLALVALAACGGGNSSSYTAAAAQLQKATATAHLQKSADAAIAGGLAGVVLNHITPIDAAQAQAGLRQVGTTAKVQADDAFMIGSTTKAMTSALAARLVERGTIAWTTTLAEALPDLAAGMQAGYRVITLEQLLGHRGGLLAFTSPADIGRFQAFLVGYDGELPATLAGRERFFAAWLLAQDPPPGVKPGQDFAYSNAGYAMAALMLEARAGRPFAELFEQDLTQPLGMTVSWTSSDQTFTNRPVGHDGAKGKLVALTPEDTDTAAWLNVLRPGGVGTTITADSYANWVRWHLRALRGEATPLPASYLQRLKTLRHGDYALGWVAIDIDGRAVLAHDGEYRGFSSLLIMDMQGRSASFGFTNTEADDGAWVMAVLNQAVSDVARALLPR